MRKETHDAGRREFLKKAALGAAAIGVGAWGLSQMIDRPRLPTVSGMPKAPAELGKFAREALNYASLGDSVRCGLCPNNCTLAPDERGICRVRANKGGKLYSLVFGNPAAVHTDPVEKKPLFHFLPGTSAFSIGTAGCNLRCLNCQNWQISQFTPEEVESREMSPQEVARNAAASGAKSVAYTYNEPVVFYEYMLESSKAARAAGLRNIMVTNGYINRAPLAELANTLDAAHVDLKGWSDETYMKLNSGTLQPVLDSLKVLAEKRVWFEIIHLAVPTWTDDIESFRGMCRWIMDNLGPDRPLHVSRFFPQHKLGSLPPTPTEYLVKARDAAMAEGLRYVYVGNAPELSLEDTICPKCGHVAVGRKGYEITHYNLEGGRCKACGEAIAGVWS